MVGMPSPIPPESQLATDIELPDAGGQPVRFSALWSAGPIALAILPPFGTEMCADNAAQLRDNDDAFIEAGGTLAAVVTASPDEASAFAREWNLIYILLCDVDGSSRTAFRLAADADGRNLPASFVIDTSGRITHEHRAASHYGYAPAWELVDEVSELTGRVVERPELPLNFAASVASLSRPLGGVRADAPVSVRNGAWSCVRCGVQQCELNDVATASGLLSRIFNLQNRRFVAVTCTGCGYTELYKRDSTAIMNIIDFLSNG